MAWSNQRSKSSISNQLASVPLRLTPLMKKRLTRRAQEMIARALPHFPELNGKTITVGYTRKHLGSASIIYRATDHPA
jgi:hypothetical protein